MPDKYELRTQYVPALLNSVPFIALGFYYVGRLSPDFWNTVSAQKAGGITLTGALYIFASFSCRDTGKWLEDKIYRKGTEFPTTKFLQAGDTNLSAERKTEICKKVKEEFKIDLMKFGGVTPQRVHEAVGQIRKKFFMKNKLITQRNTQYGFSRNLAGGALNALAASCVLTLLTWHTGPCSALHLALLLDLLYLLLFCYGFMTMRSNADRYAFALFEEYIGS